MEKLLLKRETEDEDTKQKNRNINVGGTNISPSKILFRRYISIGVQQNKVISPINYSVGVGSLTLLDGPLNKT